MFKIWTRKLPHVPFLLFLAVLNFIVYFDFWSGAKIISGRDFLLLSQPIHNFQNDCIKAGTFPSWNPFIDYGYPWIEHYANTAYAVPYVLYYLIVGADLLKIQHLEFLLVLTGGIGVYFCVNELTGSRLSSLIAAVCFMFSGQMALVPNWDPIVLNASFFPFMIYGYHRATNRRSVLSLVSIFFTSQFIVGGYMSASVLGLYFFAFYVLTDSLLNKKFRFSIRYLALTMTASLLIALPKLAAMYIGMRSSPKLGQDHQPYPDAASNLNYNDLLSFFIPVKYFYSVYVGFIPVMVVLYVLLRKKLRPDPLLIAFVVTSWYLIVDSLGNFTWLRLFLNNLPFLRFANNEWLYWFFPSTFLILYAARHLEDLVMDNVKAKLFAFFLYAAVISAVYAAAYGGVHFKTYLLQVLSALVFIAAILYSGRPSVTAVVSVAVVVFNLGLVLDWTGIHGRVLRTPTSISIATTDQHRVSHSFQDDNIVSRVKVVQFARDESRPTVDESRRFPFILSAVEAGFFEHMLPENLNNKRFAGTFYNTQPKHEYQKITEDEKAMLDGQPLVYMQDAHGGFYSDAVRIDAVSCQKFAFTTYADTEAHLILNQMHDPRWKVFVNGAAGEVAHANKYFMGVRLGPGENRVSFVFSDRYFIASCWISALTIAGLAVMAFSRVRRRKNDASTLQCA